MTERTTTIDGAVVTESQLREALGRLEHLPQHMDVFDSPATGRWLILDMQQVAQEVSRHRDASNAMLCVGSDGTVGWISKRRGSLWARLGPLTGFTHRKA